MTALTRWVLAHRKLVVAFWLVLTVIGGIASGPASRAMNQKFSVPGREGWETNVQIQRLYHGTGGNAAPLVPVVQLPAGRTAETPAVRAELREVEAKLRAALPGARIAGYGSTGDAAFISRDGRTAFAVAFATPDPDQPFGNNPRAERAARKAVAGMTVGGAPVHLSGYDALNAQSGDSDGPGVLLEALFGGLGVALDFSLLICMRWREERAHGREGDEAIVRAMETAGRAVVFSGTTVAIGLFALVALPLPFLRSVGYGGLLIPVMSVAVALTLL